MLPGMFIKTFGCQMNEYDSEKLSVLLSSTHRMVSSVDEANLILINTCSVREKGEHKLRSLLGTLRELKEKRRELVIGVGGCVAQQEGRNIIRNNPFVDFVVGTHNLSLVPSLVERAREGAAPAVAVDYREEWEELPAEFAPSEQSPVQALVSIQRGCNKNCSFCVVPTTRGREVSRAANEILREVRLKVYAGAREVLLLGQTVNSYGRDLNPRYSFAKLITEIAKIDGVKRIRFTSPHPAEVRTEFIQLYREIPQLAPHIHLPLQSGSDRILRLMNRNYRVKRYLEIVDLLRAQCSEIAISTDIIVGFPTESEADFEETLTVMRQVGYNSSYSFKYSKRPNTVALSQFEATDEVPLAVAEARLAQLQSLQKELCERYHGSFIGSVVEVLVEGRHKKISSSMKGRIPQNVLTEVQGVTTDPSRLLGQIVRIHVEEAGSAGLRGTIAREVNGYDGKRARD